MNITVFSKELWFLLGYKCLCWNFLLIKWEEKYSSLIWAFCFSILQTFNCKSYPPSLWCSSNKDVTLEFQELDSYNDRRIGDGYDLTLEVKPYCHHPTSTGFVWCLKIVSFIHSPAKLSGDFFTFKPSMHIHCLMKKVYFLDIEKSTVEITVD